MRTKISKKSMFYIFAVLSLLLPDISLRFLVWPKVYTEPFVTIVPTLFNLAWISTILYFCIAFCSKRVGKIVYSVIFIFFTGLSFSNYIYFQIFEQFFWLKSIALAGEANNYFGYALSYLDWKIAVAVLAAVLFFVITLVLWSKPNRTKPRAKIKILIPISCIFALHIFMQPALFGILDDDWDSWSKPHVIYKQFTDANKSLDVSGLYQYVARDIVKTLFPQNPYGEKEYKKVDEFLTSKPEVQKNEYSGIFKGKNVIAVMMESIDTWMINEKYTPTIKYMMDNGINFKNHFAPTFGTGYTFNTEFTFNTGFYTPKSSPTAVNYSSNSYPYSLPKLFRQEGYSANSFHYNNSEFYNRGIMHNSFGYEHYNSFMKFGLPEYAAQADSNIIKNDDIYKKMTESQPFFDFLITYSGHVPYTYNDAKLSLVKERHPELMDGGMNTEKNACLLLARDTDDFFRDLLTRLEEDGILENTVIVAFSDHYAYGFSDKDLLLEYSRDAGSGFLYQVPAFIYSPGMESFEVNKATQTIDLLPTVINLFGLENKNCYMGNDIFDSRYTGFAYFNNKSWYDGETYYEPKKDGDNKEENGYVGKRNRQVSAEIDINDIVVAGDYFAKR